MFKQSKARTDLTQPGSRPERSNIIVRLPRSAPVPSPIYTVTHSNVRLLDVWQDEPTIEERSEHSELLNVGLSGGLLVGSDERGHDLITTRAGAGIQGQHGNAEAARRGAAGRY